MFKNDTNFVSSLSTCASGTVSLHAVNTDGSLDLTALGTANIEETGKFSIKKPKNISNIKGSSIQYVLKASGCNALYYRPLTNISEQNITATSTLITLASVEHNDADRKTLTQMSTAEVETALTSLANAGDAISLTSALENIVADPEKNQSFENLLNIPPVKVKETPPLIVITAPENVMEGASATFSVSPHHWSQDYDVAYAWYLDGNLVGSNASYSYTPSKNAQGAHSLEIKVGSKTSGALDSTKPVKAENIALDVQNTFPPVTPPVSLVGGPSVATTNISLDLTTGAGFENCASFSSLALSETPTAPTSFTISCTGAGTQSLSHTISNTDGAKTLYLWAKDAAGNISSPRTLTVILDTQAPEVVISAAPASLNNQTSVSVPFSATDLSDITSYECEIDGGSFAPCSSPRSLTGLSAGNHTFKVRATDALGNTSSLATTSWTTDLTAPTVTISSAPSAFTNQLTSSFAFSATDAGGGAIASYQCSTDNGAFEICLSPLSLAFADGAHNLRVRAIDTAGNISSAATASFTTDSTRPLISFTSVPSAPQKGGGTANIQFSVTEANITTSQNFTVSYSTDNGTSWNTVGTVASNNGPLVNQIFSYALLLPAADSSQFKIKVEGSDRVGNAALAAVSNTFVLDSTRPTASALSINSGASLTSSNYVSLSFELADNNKVPAFCPKYNDTTIPSAEDACWILVTSNAAGNQMAMSNVSISNYQFTLGFGVGSFSVYLWAKDEAGNISQLTSSGTGTTAVDKATITYNPGTPPIVQSLTAANTDTPDSPATIAQLSATTGQDVYIRWTVSDDKSLPAQPIALFYYNTTNNTWVPITGAQSLVNGANGSCTVNDANTSITETGCYKWTSGSPVSTSYQIQIRVTDSDSMNASSSSNILNGGQIRTIAGNTNSGVGGSARSALLYPKFSGEQTYPGRFVVTSKGVIFIADARGLFRISPENGNLEVFIPNTGTVSGLNGPAASATLNTINRVILDHNGRVIISTSTAIYRFDPNAATPILESIFSAGNYTAIAALPNGNIYNVYGTAERGSYGSIYLLNPATGVNTELTISGTSNAHVASMANIKNCEIGTWGLAYDANTSELKYLHATNNVSNSASCGNYNGTPFIVFDPVTLVSAGTKSANPSAYPAGHPYTEWSHAWPSVVGMDGTDYLLNFNSARLYKYNRSTHSYSLILGSTSGAGYCVDGTLASNCRATPQDVFVTREGKVYVIDAEQIRVIQNDGTLFTLYGARAGDGDGGAASSARLGAISYIAPSTNGKILLLQGNQGVMREFTPGGNITKVLGNGNNATPNDGAGPTSSFTALISWGAHNKFIYDPVGNDFYFGERKSIKKFDRDTNVWSTIIGTGSGTTVLSADGLTQSQITYDSEWLMPVAFYGNKLYVQYFRQNDSNPFINYLKAYDLSDSYRQSAVAGFYNASGMLNCVTGGNVFNCQIFPRDIRTPSIVTDPSTNRMFVSSNVTNNHIYSFGTDGNITSYNMWGGLDAMAYRKITGTPDLDIIYYCGSGWTSIIRQVLSSGARTFLSLPSGMTCDGRSMIWDSANDRLIFIFKMNNAWGIAEYASPP